MRTSGRAVAYLVAVLVAVPAVGFGAIRWAGRDDGSDRAVPTAAEVATTTVTRNDMSTSTSMSGSLGYGPARKITGGQTGVITWLPRSGTTITRGHSVYRVNDRPVPLFYGKIPLYRDLLVPGTVGRDVRVVVDNLRALGYPVGAQPSSGTVHDGEAVLTPALIAAVTSWQRDLELPANGHLRIGSVVVQPKAFRVSALSAQVGDPASGELLSATSTSKVITVQADEGTAASVELGDRATVSLSDSSTTPARVTSIGTALQPQEGGDGSDPKLDITLALDHPSTVKRVDSADLQVSFAAQTHRHVLVVAVNALLALSEGGYALQPVSGELIPVKTGIFVKGLVEIRGPGVTEGMSVVTTS
jgi:hypothetical protein